MNYFILDLEVSPNCFLIGFMRVSDKKVRQFGVYGENEVLTKEDKYKVYSYVSKNYILGYNSSNYDLPVLQAMLMGYTVKQIYKISCDIVKNSLINFITMQKYDIRDFNIKGIDLMSVAPAVRISLKLYGARINSKKLQDLPYEPDRVLTKEEFEEIKLYNVNDLDTTYDLFKKVENRVELRIKMSEDYKTNLISKSDAQIAETIILHELSNEGVKVSKVTKLPLTVKYEAPEFISFVREDINELLEGLQSIEFDINPKNGSPRLPKLLNRNLIKIGATKYKVGLGGLHSQEKKLVRKGEIYNADVASYYPSLLLEYDYYPKHIGKKFLKVYSRIKEIRLKAKANLDIGDNKTVNDTLKITLNGTFGKLGSMYSKLYAPDMLLQITITGQLMLLMLIEQLELHGATVISANTDGVEYMTDNLELCKRVIFDWELLTGMDMEHGKYKALYARDVNNYVAIYDGYCKTKGVFTKAGLSKNSEYPIVYEAIREFLLNKTPITETIFNCNDVTQFLSSRTVAGGGVWKDNYLGKVVRWYYSQDGATINYKKNGNKVPKSDFAYPLMDLPNNNVIPDNLDKRYYISLVLKHLEEMGVNYEE